jgi:muconolactone delta-isomerase
MANKSAMGMKTNPEVILETALRAAGMESQDMEAMKTPEGLDPQRAYEAYQNLLTETVKGKQQLADGVLSKLWDNNGNTDTFTSMGINSAEALKQQLAATAEVLQEQGTVVPAMLESPESKSILQRGWDGFTGGMKSALEWVGGAAKNVVNFPRNHPVIFSLMVAAALAGLGAYYMSDAWTTWGQNLPVPDTMEYVTPIAETVTQAAGQTQVPLAVPAPIAGSPIQEAVQATSKVLENIGTTTTTSSFDPNMFMPPK